MNDLWLSVEMWMIFYYSLLYIGMWSIANQRLQDERSTLAEITRNFESSYGGGAISWVEDRSRKGMGLSHVLHQKVWLGCIRAHEEEITREHVKQPMYSCVLDVLVPISFKAALLYVGVHQCELLAPWLPLVLCVYIACAVYFRYLYNKTMQKVKGELASLAEGLEFTLENLEKEGVYNGK